MTPHELATTAASGAVQNAGFNPATSRDIAIIAIAAYLRARKEIDGAVMCVVPAEKRDD